MKNVITLLLVGAVSAGCGVYSANNLKAASTPLENEDFTSYVARLMKGHLGYKSDGTVYIPTVDVVTDKGKETFKSYLTTYCNQRGGRVRVENDTRIEYNFGNRATVHICTINDREFLAGIAYEHGYDIVKKFTVISPQIWSEITKKIALEDDAERKNEVKRLQEEREQRAFANSVKLGMTVNFSKPELGIPDGHGIGVVQQINQRERTVTILATNVFNRDDSNAKIPMVSIDTLRKPYNTKVIIQLPINLK